MDRHAGLHRRRWRIAALPEGGARERQVELLRRMGVGGVKDVGAEHQHAQGQAVAGDWAAQADQLGPAITLEKGLAEIGGDISLTAGTVLNLLVGGPSFVIAPAVSTAVADDVAYTGSTDGVYRFTGLADAEEKTRARFAAQVVWTLAAAGVPGPYPVTLNGVPVVGETAELSDLVEQPRWEVRVGWLTYLSKRLGRLPPLPAPVRIEPVGELGWLLILSEEPLSAGNPEHVALAVRIRELLDRAGLIALPNSDPSGG